MLGTNSELTIGVPSREPTNAEWGVSVLVVSTGGGVSG